nr:uncharacterized protein LOC102150405 [Equus caballus]
MNATFYSSNRVRCRPRVPLSQRKVRGPGKEAPRPALLPVPRPSRSCRRVPALSRLLRGSRGPGHRVLCGRVHTDRAGVAGSLPACGAPAGPAQLCPSRRLGGPGPAAQGPGDRARASPSAGSPSGLGAKGRGGVRSVPHHEGPPRGPSCFRTRGLLRRERGPRETRGGRRRPARPSARVSGFRGRRFETRLRSERPAPKSPRDAQGRCHTRLRSPTPGVSSLRPQLRRNQDSGPRSPASVETRGPRAPAAPARAPPGPRVSRARAAPRRGPAGSPCVLPPPGSAEKTPEAGSGRRRAPALPPRGHARGGATAGLPRCGRRPPPGAFRSEAPRPGLRGTAGLTASRLGKSVRHSKNPSFPVSKALRVGFGLGSDIPLLSKETSRCRGEERFTALVHRTGSVRRTCHLCFQRPERSLGILCFSVGFLWTRPCVPPAPRRRQPGAGLGSFCGRAGLRAPATRGRDRPPRLGPRLFSLAGEFLSARTLGIRSEDEGGTRTDTSWERGRPNAHDSQHRIWGFLPDCSSVVSEHRHRIVSPPHTRASRWNARLVAREEVYYPKAARRGDESENLDPSPRREKGY